MLLNRIEEIAETAHCRTVLLESPEDRTLAEMLVPKLRGLLLKLSALEAAKATARQALSVLRAFAGVFKVGLEGMDFGVAPEVGTADSATSNSTCRSSFRPLRRPPRQPDRGDPLLKVQYLSEADLAALIVSIHKVGQKQLPMVLFGAGLPQLAALAGDAKSYAERLFDYPSIGPLSADAARDAIIEPLKRESVAVTDRALQIIIDRTAGYPYFLQEWGAHAWNAAAQSPITEEDVVRATDRVLERLDSGIPSAT